MELALVAPSRPSREMEEAVMTLKGMEFNPGVIDPQMKRKRFTESAIRGALHFLLKTLEWAEIRERGYEVVIDYIFPEQKEERLRRRRRASLEATEAARRRHEICVRQKLEAYGEPIVRRIEAPPPRNRSGKSDHQVAEASDAAARRRAERLALPAAVSNCFKPKKTKSMAQVHPVTVVTPKCDPEPDWNAGVPDGNHGVSPVSEVLQAVSPLERPGGEVVQRPHSQGQLRILLQSQRSIEVNHPGVEPQAARPGGEDRQLDGNGVQSPVAEVHHPDPHSPEADVQERSPELQSEVRLWDSEEKPLASNAGASVVLMGVPKTQSTEQVRAFVVEVLNKFEFVPVPGSGLVNGVDRLSGSETEDMVVVHCHSETVAEIFVEASGSGLSLGGRTLGLARNFLGRRDYATSDLAFRAQNPYRIIYINSIAREWMNKEKLGVHLRNITRRSEDVLESAHFFPATSDGYVELKDDAAVDLVMYRCWRRSELLYQMGPQAWLCRGETAVALMPGRVWTPVTYHSDSGSSDASPGGTPRGSQRSLDMEIDESDRVSTGARPSERANRPPLVPDSVLGKRKSCERNGSVERKRTSRFSPSFSPTVPPEVPPGFESGHRYSTIYDKDQRCLFMSSTYESIEEPKVRAAITMLFNPPDGSTSDPAFGSDEIVAGIQLVHAKSAIVELRSLKFVDRVMKNYVKCPAPAFPLTIYRHKNYDWSKTVFETGFELGPVESGETCDLIVSNVPILPLCAVKGVLTEVIRSWIARSGLTDYNIYVNFNQRQSDHGQSDRHFVRMPSPAHVDFLVGLKTPVFVAGQRVFFSRDRYY